MPICEEHKDVIDENNQYKYGNWTNVDNHWMNNLDRKPHLKCNQCGQVYSIPIEVLRSKSKIVCKHCGNT